MSASFARASDVQLDLSFAAINGGMQMPGWFDLYDWPIGVNARDDREGKIAAAEQIEKVRAFNARIKVNTPLCIMMCSIHCMQPFEGCRTFRKGRRNLTSTYDCRRLFARWSSGTSNSLSSQN